MIGVRARAMGVCVVAAAAMIVGCRSDQRRDVEAYRQVSDPPGALPRHEAGAAVSLIEAMRLTAAYNEQLAVRGEQYVQALADRQRAAAALKPTLDLFADVDLRENTGSDPVARVDAGMSGQYRLLTGMGDLRSVDAARVRAETRRWLILDLREGLLLETARAYYEALRAERLIEVLESSVQTQIARLEEARARNEVGFARPLDVAQIEAQVSRTRTQLITARRQAGEARAILALLTNASLEGAGLVDGFEPVDDGRENHELLAIARANRQDIVAARREAEAARLLVDTAISQYAPTVSVNLDYFLLRSPDESAAAIASMIQVRVPVFSAGRIEADVRSSWSVFRQRVLEYRLRSREAARDVETAALQVKASRERSRELATQVQVAGQTLALAEASYEAGLGTNLERVTAQDQLLTAELEATSEEFTAKTASISLLRACGLLSSRMLDSSLPTPPPGPAPDSALLDRSSASQQPAENAQEGGR